MRLLQLPSGISPRPARCYTRGTMQDSSTYSEQAPPLPETLGKATNRSALFIVFIVVFIDLLGFAIVLPMLPIIGDKYAGVVAAEGNSHDFVVGTILGLLMASFS